MAPLNLTNTLPIATTQQFIIESFITIPLALNAFVYPLSSEWYSDWQSYVQGSSSPNFHRPLELSLSGENKILNENTWTAFSKWYGISENHDLARFQVKEMSSANFDQDFLVLDIQRYTGYGGEFQPFIGPRFRFLRAEQLGYVMWQMRHHFRVNPLSKTRLWYGYHVASTKRQERLITQLNKTLAEVHLACDGRESGIFGPTIDLIVNATAQFPDRNLANIRNSGYSSLEQYYKNTGQYHPIYNRHRNGQSQPSIPPPTTDFSLILEVFDDTKGKWPTGIFPDQLPTNPFEEMYRLSRFDQKVVVDNQEKSQRKIDEPQNKQGPHSSDEAARNGTVNEDESLARAKAFRQSLHGLQSNFLNGIRNQLSIFIEETVKAVEDEFGVVIGKWNTKDSGNFTARPVARGGAGGGPSSPTKLPDSPTKAGSPAPPKNDDDDDDDDDDYDDE